MTTDGGPHVELDGDFSLSLWIDVPEHRAGAAGGLAAKFDPSMRTGFSLSAISSAGGYNGPGDQLRLEVTKDRNRGPVWKFNGVAKVGDQVVAEADFAAMIRDV